MPKPPPAFLTIMEATEELQRRGGPLCREFEEMIIAASMSDESSTVAPTLQAFDVATRDASQAEATGAAVVAMCAAFARKTKLDENALSDLVRLATLYAMRFEEYLAERTAGDAI